MPPRKFPALIWLAVMALLAVAIACGGGDDDDDANGGNGQLSDPNNVPTATMWQEAPEVIILDPDNIQPLPTDQPSTGGNNGGGDGGNTEPTATPEAGEPGVCGDTYTVESGDTTFGIAEKCGVNPDDIITANPDIDPRSLSVGQVINLPAASGDDSGQ